MTKSSSGDSGDLVIFAGAVFLGIAVTVAICLTIVIVAAVTATARTEQWVTCIEMGRQMVKGVCL